MKHGLLNTIDRCLTGGQYILGDHVKQFEHQFAKYIDTKYCIGVANGAQALEIGLLALGIGKGDEVITVSLSAAETALAISHTGATPVFVDIDHYYQMDPDKIEAVITSRTKAILPVHLYGQLADMQRITKFAKKYKLFLIEDACQAHGASFGRNNMAGSLGTIAAFSFYPTKNLGAYGDAGAITTNSTRLYNKCIKLRNSGKTNRYEHVQKGINSRLDEIQAAILLHKLPYLKRFNKKRVRIAKLYHTYLDNIKELELPKLRKNTSHVFHLFVIQTKKRNALQAYLKQNGIETRVHYPIPIHKQTCYKEYQHVSLPNTEQATREILSLPIHPYLTDAEVRFVCNHIRRFFAQTARNT